MFRRLLDYAVVAVLFGLLAFMTARLDRTQMREATGIAVVADGDSLTLAGERIRLRGIDAPEYTQLCQRRGAAYSCGREARNALVRLVAGHAVSCAGWRRDRYGRLLGDCTAGGKDINRTLVEGGWAVAYGDFEAEETAARAAKRGIWAGEFEEPQDYRRHRGEMLELKHDFLGGIGDWLRAIFSFW